VSGHNTHDCHTMLSLFLAIAIRVVNHPYLKMVITRMCHFFNAISKKVIDVVELDEIRKEMRVTMCQLEMCFPPSFFDTISRSDLCIRSYVHASYVPIQATYGSHERLCMQSCSS
jgi:hypothetical protein